VKTEYPIFHKFSSFLNHVDRSWKFTLILQLWGGSIKIVASLLFVVSRNFSFNSNISESSFVDGPGVSLSGRI
jgi:hypothetical protein